MKIITLSNCDTCKKALKELKNASIEAEVIDIRKDGLTAELVDSVLAQKGEAALNKASTTWRGLPEDKKTRPVRELILENPTLLKRPAIEKDGDWYLGWKADVQAIVLK